MPDQTQSNNQQQVIVYALIAIAVLLAAIVGFMIYQRTTALPGPTTATTGSTTTAGTTGSSTTAGAAGSSTTPGSASIAPVPFDPKTATKLASGLTPETAIKAYNDAVMANTFDKAYAILPLAQKQSYASADGMAAQIKPYGITGFKVGPSTVNGNDTVIVVETDTPAMNITYTWTFTKDGGQWYVKSRTMGGSL
jgi:hypothetical protein